MAGHDLVIADAGGSESERGIEDNPYLRLAKSALISGFLASVIEATAADFGNVQLFDSTNQVLRIVAQHGFESEFLDYFDTVCHRDECVCGAAMNGRSRTIVTDVATDPLLSSESRGVLLRANVRSIQSTPLIDPQGKFIGMVSTHCGRAGTPSIDALRRFDKLAATIVVKISVSGQQAELTE